jgi:hypothetical protein
MLEFVILRLLYVYSKWTLISFSATLNMFPQLLAPIHLANAATHQVSEMKGKGGNTAHDRN